MDTTMHHADSVDAHRRAAADLYLDLLKRSLYNLIDGDAERIMAIFTSRLTLDFESTAALIGRTMIGLGALDDLRFCVEDVLRRDVPGDLLEAGVWRGGACIFMRAILRACDVTDRTVWVADSFAGVPPPRPSEYPLDKGLDLHVFPDLAVSLEQVQNNFARYGLLDNQVRFLKGFFRDTMPAAPVGRLAVLRLDGDLYESTWQVLDSLYPRVSVGGYVIVDDYGAIEACRAAVHDYRRQHGVRDPIVVSDRTVVYWQRSAAGPHLDPATLDALDRANADHAPPDLTAASIVPAAGLYPPRATREMLQRIDGTLDGPEGAA